MEISSELRVKKFNTTFTYFFNNAFIYFPALTWKRFACRYQNSLMTIKKKPEKSSQLNLSASFRSLWNNINFQGRVQNQFTWNFVMTTTDFKSPPYYSESFFLFGFDRIRHRVDPVFWFQNEARVQNQLL